MNHADVDTAVRQALSDVAPDVDASAVDPNADFHDELGLDSMDALNLAIALHEKTGVDIPERDYPQITSIATCIAYLDARLSS